MATPKAIAAVKRAKVSKRWPKTPRTTSGQAGRLRHPQRCLRGVLEGREAAAVEDHRALELARLDALQVALWDDAIAGNVRAAGMLLKLIEQRCRLLGLEQVNSSQGAQTVVMSPAEVAAWEGNARAG